MQQRDGPLCRQCQFAPLRSFSGASRTEWRQRRPSAEPIAKPSAPNAQETVNDNALYKAHSLGDLGHKESYAILSLYLEVHSGQSGFLVYTLGTAGAAEIMKK